jgi:hypothetical protein
VMAQLLPGEGFEEIEHGDEAAVYSSHPLGQASTPTYWCA